ncbi:hypothetical protein ACFL3V_06480 [Nanoarchaeota archaeon]
METQTAERLEQLTEGHLQLRPYKGLETTLRLYLPEHLSENVKQGLDILKADAPEHYRLIEDHVQTIRLSAEEFNYSAVSEPAIYLSMNTIMKGRVHCAVLSVHEAKHRQLSDNNVMPWEQKDACLEAEADCLEALGERHWKELNMGFNYSRGAYLGLRRVNSSS